MDNAGAWTEGPYGMLTNPHAELGGIIDRALVSKKWFIVFHGDRAVIEELASQDEAIGLFFEARVQDAIDAAGPAGMALGEAGFDLELASRLDAVAVCVMGLRPDLSPASLDDWLANNMDTLSAGVKRAAQMVLEAY